MKLESFLKQFGMSSPPDAKLLNRSYFIVPDLSWIKFNPEYVGECIAHERGDVIIPSIDFLQVIGRQANNKVIVSDKGAWLFICGRDLFSENIVEHFNAKLNDFVAVINQHKECIGYGQVVADFSGSRAVVKRLFDIGDLLRRENKKRKVKR